MKSTKTMFFAALAVGGLLALSMAVRAADTNTPPSAPPVGQRPPGMRGGPTLDQLTQQLSLTDDQKAKVKIVLDARDQKLKDLRADTTLSPEDRRAQMQAIRQDVTAQLKAILTPEQFAKYQKMTPMGRGPRNGPPPGGNPPPAGTPPPAAPPQQ